MEIVMDFNFSDKQELLISEAAEFSNVLPDVFVSNFIKSEEPLETELIREHGLKLGILAYAQKIVDDKKFLESHTKR